MTELNASQIKHYENKLQYEMDAWDLYEHLQANSLIQVIDARSAEAFALQHIPGAVNLPHRQMTAESTAHLDKRLTYICYCDGIGCNASTKGALNMAKLGFNTKELIGGLDWWIRDGYATEGTQAQPGQTIVCGC